MTKMIKYLNSRWEKFNGFAFTEHEQFLPTLFANIELEQTSISTYVIAFQLYISSSHRFFSCIYQKIFSFYLKIAILFENNNSFGLTVSNSRQNWVYLKKWTIKIIFLDFIQKEIFSKIVIDSFKNDVREMSNLWKKINL